MAGSNADIQLLFGVRGGGEVSGESGRKIQSELQSIIDTLNKQGVYKIKVGIDDSSLKQISSQIENAFKGLSNIDIGKSVSTVTRNVSSRNDDSFIKDDTAKLLQALLQIESAKHSINEAVQKALRFDDGDGTGTFISELNAASEAFKNLERNAEDAELTPRQYIESFRKIALSANQAKDGLAEYISEYKTLQKTIGDSPILTANNSEGMQALTKIEAAKQVVDTSMAKLSSLKQTSDVISFTDTLSTTRQMYDDLSSSVSSGSITLEQYNKEMAAVKLMLSQTQTEINQYTAALKASDTQTKEATLTESDITNAQVKAERARHSLQTLLQDATKLNTERPSVDTQQHISNIQGMIDKYRDLSNVSADATTNKRGLNEQFAKLNLETLQLSNAYKEYVKDQKEVIRQEKAADAAEKERISNLHLLKEGTSQYYSASEKITKSLKDIAGAKDSFSFLSTKAGAGELASLESYRKKLDDLYKKLQSGTLGQEEFNKSINQLQGEISGTISSLSSYQTPLEKLKTNVSGITKEFLGFYSAHQLVSKGIAVLKDMVNQSIELENAFADTRIVTHATKEELTSYADSVAESAQKLSVPMESLISATTTYARLGYNLKESSTLAEFTAMLEKVGDIDTESAENSITAILKAFPDDANITNIESVMDRLVKTGRIVARVHGNMCREIGYNGQSRFGISA